MPYGDADITYDLWYQPLWDWGLDLLRDPRLAERMVWDAQRLYKHNGTEWVRFYHEPWTAKTWWKIQVGGHTQTYGLLTLCISHNYLRAQNRYALFYMLTRLNYPLSARGKATL